MSIGPYLQSIRKKIGQAKIIYPGARIIIENAKGEFLFIHRKDNGMIGLPAGGLEENETITDCIYREVWEETGLQLLETTIIGISSDPHKELSKYPNGDIVQYFTVEFYSNSWKGNLKINDGAEISSVAFLPENNIYKLPPNEFSTWKSLDYYRRNGIIKVN